MSSNIVLHKSSLCGRRPTNEDAEVYFINLSNGSINSSYAPVDFFAICDGHGGSEVSEFVSAELKRYLTNRNITYPLQTHKINGIYDSIQKKLINHPKKIADGCGSTALVLVRYFDSRTNQYGIQVINSGDCRAVLSRNGLAIPLTKDHKPFWSDERRRIDMVNKKHSMNNQIEFLDGDWRIGDLSVSRSFGDLDNTPHVTHIPESFCYELMAEDEFVIMACDGLWDVMENHEAVNFVRDHLTNNHIDLYEIPGKYPTTESIKKKNISRKLADYAIAMGSGDNVSVFIIFFV